VVLEKEKLDFSITKNYLLYNKFSGKAASKWVSSWDDAW